MYKIEFLRPAQQALQELPADIQRRLDPAILALANHPRPPGCIKLSGNESLWRIRVGAYRIVYQILDDRLLVLVVKVGHRRDIYR